MRREAKGEIGKMKNFAGLIALLLFLTGCSASGPRFQDTPFVIGVGPDY
jgi:hypothetical protein